MWINTPGCSIKGMKTPCNTAVLVLGLIVLVWSIVASHPVGSPEVGLSIKNISSHHNNKDEQEMRNIPQWHCLRYRRFALVRRCRNYRRH